MKWPQFSLAAMMVAFLVFGGATGATWATWEEIEAGCYYKPHPIPDDLAHRLELQFIIGTICFTVGCLWFACALWTKPTKP